jgi:hypothetical protein
MIPNNRACSELNGIMPAGKPYISPRTSSLSANRLDAFFAASIVSRRQAQKLSIHALNSVVLVTDKFRSGTPPLFLSSERRSIGDQRIIAAPKLQLLIRG